MLDKIDKDILRELQVDAKQKTYQLSKKLNIPRTTIHNRIRKLEKEGVIKNYKAIVDPKKLNKKLTVLIGIVTGLEAGSREVASKLAKIPHVEEVYIISGQFDILVKVRLRDTDELAKLIFSLESGLRSLHGITKTESMIVLGTENEDGITDIE